MGGATGGGMYAGLERTGGLGKSGVQEDKIKKLFSSMLPATGKKLCMKICLS